MFMLNFCYGSCASLCIIDVSRDWIVKNILEINGTVQKTVETMKSRLPTRNQFSILTHMAKQDFETLWRRDHIIERFEAWCKIGNESLGIFVEMVEKDQCVGSILGNQFRILLTKPAVWRVPCKVCGFLMQATRFQRLQVLIAAHKSSSELRKHYQS